MYLAPINLPLVRTSCFPISCTLRIHPAFWHPSSLTSSIMRDNLNTLHTAQEAFIQNKCSEHLQRALNHNNCTYKYDIYLSSDCATTNKEQNVNGRVLQRCSSKMANRYSSNTKATTTFEFILADSPP